MKLNHLAAECNASSFWNSPPNRASWIGPQIDEHWVDSCRPSGPRAIAPERRRTLPRYDGGSMDAIAVQSGHEDSADPLRYITNEELRGFYLISPWRIAIDTTITWATVFGAIWLWAVTANAASYALAFFLIATRQHALNTFVHEAAHFNISRKKWWNDFLSDVLYATPHLINTDSYRGKHLEHHKHLGDHNRDQEFKARYVIRGTRFLRYSVTTLSGWGLLHAVRSYVPSLSDRRAPRRRYVLLVALTNGLLFAYCWAVRAPWAFLTLWLLPLFTLTL